MLTPLSLVVVPPRLPSPHQAAVQDELALGRFNITVLDARNEHECGLVCIYMVVEVVSIYDFLNMFS